MDIRVLSRGQVQYELEECFQLREDFLSEAYVVVDWRPQEIEDACVEPGPEGPLVVAAVLIVLNDLLNGKVAPLIYFAKDLPVAFGQVKQYRKGLPNDDIALLLRDAIVFSHMKCQD